MADTNPWMADPLSGGGGAGISGPGGTNPTAKKKKKAANPYRVDPRGGGGGADITGPGGENPYAKPKKSPAPVIPPKTSPQSFYHGWQNAEDPTKQWGVWGPLTAGSGGTGGRGGSAFNFLHALPPEQKRAVFGWIGKNYDPASGQGGNIGAAQELLKKGDYQGFLKMVGAQGAGPTYPGQVDTPQRYISGPGGENPNSPPYQVNTPQRYISGPGGINPAYGQFGVGGGGGMNAPINGPQFSMDPTAGGGAAPINKNTNPYLNAFRW